MADVVKTIKLKDEIVIPPLPAPDPLSDFVAGISNPNEIDLGWTDNGVLALNYEIEYAFDHLFSSPTLITIAASPGVGGIYTLTALTSAVTYYIRIRATNASGASAWETTSATTI